MDDFGFRRQFGGHLFLGTTQQEGFYPTVEVLQADVAGVLFNRYAVVAVKAFDVSQPAGQQEVEQ